MAQWVIGSEKPSALQATRHRVLDVTAHQEVVARVRAAATSDTPVDVATATLLALSGPCYLLEVVAPDKADRKGAKQRIKAATDRVPAAAAAKKAVEAAQSAVAAATAGAAAVAASSS